MGRRPTEIVPSWCETVHQKLVGGCAQKRPPGVALLDLKVWRGQMDDKRGSSAKETCDTSERLRLDGVSVHGPNTRTVGFRMFLKSPPMRCIDRWPKTILFGKNAISTGHHGRFDF